jgi:hypothetical protein
LVTSFLLKHVVEGKIKGKKIRRRWYKQQLGDLKEKRRYLNLKEETSDRSLWRTGFGRLQGPA